MTVGFSLVKLNAYLFFLSSKKTEFYGAVNNNTRSCFKLPLNTLLDDVSQIALKYATLFQVYTVKHNTL